MRNGKFRLSGQVIVTGVFFLILIFCGRGIYDGFGDDLSYAKVIAKGDFYLGAFLKDRYDWWSSRVVIEAVMMPLIAASPYLWWILNICMIMILVKITADLFGVGDKLQAQVIFFVLMWLVPVNTINGAGWIVTTTNYLWPLTLGLVAMRPLKSWFQGEKCARWEYIICPMCMIYASNAEQMAAILIGVYLLSGICLVIGRKRISFLYMIQTGLAAASLYFIRHSYGNINRLNYEIQRYFPEFTELGAGSKLLMGFLDTAHYYLGKAEGRNCYLFVCMAGVLFFCLLDPFAAKGKEEAVAVWKKCLRLVTAACPLLAYYMCVHLFPFLLYRLNVPWWRNLFVVFSENRYLPMQSPFPAYVIVLQAVFYLAVFGCVALAIYFLHGRTFETALEILILCIGFASRVVVGFSPTLYVSGNRTTIFCDMAILIVMLRNMQFWWKKRRHLGQNTF